MQTRIFDPLGMHDTTFDNAIGESGELGPSAHGFDIDGNMVEMSNYFNHLIVPFRAGRRRTGRARRTWPSTSSQNCPRGVTTDGKRLVSETNILERRKKGVPTGEDAWYGMGLFYEIVDGVPVVTHGGTLQGFHSDWWALPDADIGAVILTNADSGPYMLAPFLRRLMEVVYDGKPQAADEVATAAARLELQAKVRRAKLTIPGDPAVLANLAAKYHDSVVGNTITLTDKDESSGSRPASSKAWSPRGRTLSAASRSCRSARARSALMR